MITIEAFITYIYDCVVVNHLRKLYFFGPSIYNVGFWNGRHQTEICQQISGYNQIFWSQHWFECYELTEERFVAFKTTIEVVLYFTMLFHGVLALLRQCSTKKCVTNPERQYYYILGH